jgi:hypothetical protein
VALVIVADVEAGRGLGSALGQDPLQGTAAAALEAVGRVREASARIERDGRMDRPPTIP